MQYAEEAALGAEVSLRLDAQILQTIRDYRGALAADRLDTAEDCGAELRSLVMKRDYTYSDTEDLSAQMAELQSQLSSLRAQAGSSVRQITAPQAGLYSAVVDGYENILTPESLETLTPRTLAALEPDESLRSNRVGKLVLGDTWYYVTALEESEAQTLQESGRLKLRFAKGVGRDLSVKLTYISEAEGGRVVAVFGCGGDRDREKRPQMGRIVSRLADVAVVTSDNPRWEQPEKIIEDILPGLTGPAESVVICDRREAIGWVLKNSRPKDVIVLCGKGHETYQEVCGEKRHMDERELVAAYTNG